MTWPYSSVFVDSNGTVIFSMDGVNVASIVTHVPSTSTLMQNCINVDNIDLANNISQSVSFLPLLSILAMPSASRHGSRVPDSSYA
jgi:hypothetical protein